MEKLAMQVQTRPDDLLWGKDEGLRLAVINCSVGIDKRFVKMYDLIENELLGQLQFSASYVAPYKVGVRVCVCAWSVCMSVCVVHRDHA